MLSAAIWFIELFWLPLLFLAFFICIWFLGRRYDQAGKEKDVDHDH